MERQVSPGGGCLGTELGQDTHNVSVHRGGKAFDLHHQSHREFPSPVAQGNQEQKPFPNRYGSAEAFVSCYSEDPEEMDYEAKELGHHSCSALHPLRGKGGEASMILADREFTQNY